jgi:hypothetical protein
MTIQEQVDNAAIQILKESPEGVRFTELWHGVRDRLPDTKENTVFSMISTIATRRSSEVTRPSRGLYRLTGFGDECTEKSGDALVTQTTIKEEQFYEPFAEWLVGELEECTKAIALGGNLFGGKWGTPDVIGVREPRKSDIIKFATEIVSAEVKLDVYGLITAFGQACAYRLFSHKSYLVVPSTSPQADLARLDTLCRIFEIGLILFDIADPQNPAFDIRVRATSRDPDMFYVNQCMKLVEDDLFT